MSAIAASVLFATLFLGNDPAAAILATASPVSEIAPPRAAQASDFDPGHLPFSLTIRGELSVNYETFAIFARPGEQVRIEADRPLSWIDDDVMRAASPELDWTAPATPGLTRVQLEDDAGHVMNLNLIVMRSSDGDSINGYQLGNYPAEPYLGHENYRAPEFFLEVDSDLGSIAVSPHFRLEQFLCKQEADGPQYLVLSERLLVKLERILEAANDHGWRTDGFTVMSGYRTPAYNADLGNGENSRHIYGGAADIYIDTDGDDVMDDLNGDGALDRADAAALFDLVQSLADTPLLEGLAGGLGEYAPNAWHGPFVHVDERGWNVQWGR
ncbi:D-Ala-D-Ala carboxypeptidase family metallohydrolase [Maricaulis sp.]|uniref:D-Ala-D-Ala carboxypeptidase family metallohydrolase n=1 Tax=Maricaulis sp. TaxID=1486257 RepID=UPI003A93421B